MQINEKDKLVALAHLHAGKKPKEIPELVPSISYPQALRLRKELEKAIENDTLQSLFDLEQAALDSLMETVTSELNEATLILAGDSEPLKNAVGNIANSIEGTKLLEAELADAGRKIVAQIKVAAVGTSSTESLLILAEALAKLQTAFFKTGNVQIANLGGSEGFEKYLKD